MTLRFTAVNFVPVCKLFQLWCWPTSLSHGRSHALHWNWSVMISPLIRSSGVGTSTCDQVRLEVVRSPAHHSAPGTHQSNHAAAWLWPWDWSSVTILSSDWSDDKCTVFWLVKWQVCSLLIGQMTSILSYDWSETSILSYDWSDYDMCTVFWLVDHTHLEADILLLDHLEVLVQVLDPLWLVSVSCSVVCCWTLLQTIK